MALGGRDPRRSDAGNYLAFSRKASGRSPAYEALARSVAGGLEILDFLAVLPRPKRQPNLLFDAARFLLGDPVRARPRRADAAGPRR